MRGIYFSMHVSLSVSCSFALLSAFTAPQTEAKVSVEWRLIANRPDNSFLAKFTLRNESTKPLPKRWSLYFNSSRRLQSESVQPPMALEHINGDFYALRPTADTPPLAPGAQFNVVCTGGPWAINVSDAPAGFYLVEEDESGAELPPVSVALKIARFPEAKLLVRGAGDLLPIATPASRFAENEKLTLLPLASVPRVLPTPVLTTALSGTFAINSRTTIVHDLSLVREASFLKDALKALSETSIRTTTSSEASGNAIRLRLGDISVAGIAKQPGDEAYFLTIDPAGVEIVGSDAAGVLYGIQTLRALVPLAAYRQPTPELVIDSVRVEDAPRFHYRGMHLDVARNFQSKATVKKLLDLMAFYKMNRFHWHLSDDEGWRFEIKALPELTEIGGRRGHTVDESQHLVPSLGSGPIPISASKIDEFYSQDDVIEILQFAAERHIEVIPEIDFPGHARAAIKAMSVRGRRLLEAGRNEAAREFLLTDPADTSKYESVQHWHDNVADVGLESTYRFLEVVVAEVQDVYRRAGLPLNTVHLGGDEVPAGAWHGSPACNALEVTLVGERTRNQQLQLYFRERVCELLAKHDIRPAIWESGDLFDKVDGRFVAQVFNDSAHLPVVYAWNNIWGWRYEDAAYQLANAGYDVVLASATHLYLDLASEKEPDEIGYYWAGFVGDRKPFEYNPLDYFQNAECDLMGRQLASNHFADRVRLTDNGKRHIQGIQGTLWSEILRTPQNLEYMAFPRMIALAERAWAGEPKWTRTEERPLRVQEIQNTWNVFANCLGQRELPRLDYLYGGVAYRLPPPGANVSADGVRANVSYPGLTIRYTLDGNEPSSQSPVYQAPLPLKESVQFRTFDSRGRGGRPVAIGVPTRD